ncbi:uroporphyrinogen decarboxylase family protein [Chloroflexota bacterium]
MSELTSRERLLLALQCKEPDRAPIWMLFPKEQLPYYADVYQTTSYAPMLPYLDQTDWLDRRNFTRPPFLTAAAEIKHEVFADGDATIDRKTIETPAGPLTSQVRRRADGSIAPGDSWLYFREIADIEKALSIPYEPFTPPLDEWNRAAGELGDAGLMMGDFGTAIAVLYHACNTEDFCVWSLTELETLKHFVSVMHERSQQTMHYLLENGVGPVWFLVGSEFVIPPLVSPTVFEHLVAPFDGQLIDMIHDYDGYAIVHHHGNINQLLEGIADMGANAIHPIEAATQGDCSMSDAKRRVGDRVCLIGSVQYGDIQLSTEEDIEAQVRQTMIDAGVGGGLILAPTAGPYETTITANTTANYIRFIEASRRWGQYPMAL